MEFQKILDNVDPQVLSVAVINLDNVAYNYHKIEDDDLVQDMLKLIEKHTKPRKPWYKRLWAWITRKK